MPERELEDITGDPEHYRNAESFIATIIDEISQRYKDLEFTATNQTQEDMWLYPGAAEAARLEGDYEGEQEFWDSDRETDIESANATRVAVSIAGDRQERIEKATTDINKEAKKRNGEQSDDSGINEHGGRKSLPKILGPRAKLEDLPLYERFLEYRFT